jgi:superfamily I DNA/RNA helicase
MLNPTDEQLKILDQVAKTNSNLMVNALAGSGKTSTLKLIEAASPIKPILFLAFGKKNAEDGRKTMASTTKVSTFNSLGHGIWGQAIGKCFKPDVRKTGDIYRQIIADAKPSEKGKLWEAYWPVVEAVGYAKSRGYIPTSHVMHTKRLCAWEEPDDFVHQQVDHVLNLSIAAAYKGSCDFDDQIYMPALFSGTFPKFPLVMVDEYQDLNPCNHAMITKLTKSSRLIGVGDPHQSIYAFRGAQASGMADAVRAYSMTECDLTVSFRCPEAIVRSVQWHVPKFRWAKTGGNVTGLNRLDVTKLPAETTFICRNNVPLISLAMRCLSAGIGVNVSGSDIGPKLVRQMKKLGKEDMPRTALKAAIAEWRAAKEDRGSRTAADTAACMQVFADHGANLGQAIAYAEHLFKQDSGQFYFTTIHKAKGLEYPTVVMLDQFLIGHNEQEKNLSYVGATRSSDQLYYVNSGDVNVK